MQTLAATTDGGVFTVQPEQVNEYWPHFEPHLRRFEFETLMASADDVRSECAGSLKQLWGYASRGQVIGCVVTYIYKTTRGKVCCIWAACGTVDDKRQLSETFTHIERWAKSLGCVALEIQGRRGWQRVLPGFKRTAVVLEKDLR